jgi:integrase/recombinase XerC
METTLVPVSSGGGLKSLRATLAEAFLAGRSPQTLRAYRADLEDFRSFVGAVDLNEASGLLVGRSHGEGNGLALAYRADLVGRGLAAATINRRLASLRSLVKLARTLGLVAWTLEIENLSAEPYRDTRGCGRGGVRLILDELDRRVDAKAARDRAIIHLLYDLALRRAEVVRLDHEDLDLERDTVSVLGKGRTGKVFITLPEPTKAALAGWLLHRGNEPGPLFVTFDRGDRGKRLTPTGLYLVVRELGLKTGQKVRPHGLRHAAITAALDATGGNVRAVQRFSRHRDLRVLNTYDDNRADLAGDVARLVAQGA